MSQAQRLTGRHFFTTKWSLIHRAGAEESNIRRPALAELLAIYRPALRAYLIETKRLDEQRADDLLQEFITVKFLERNMATQADQRRGRFRSFVLTSLDHFLLDVRRRELAEKRIPDRGANIDPEVWAVQPAGSPSPADAFDLAWAQEVLANVIRSMQAECNSKGRLDLWGVFEKRLLTPIFDGTPPLGYDELAEQLGLGTKVKAEIALTTAKRMFIRHLRNVVSGYVDSPDEVQEEIDDLQAILARAGSP